LNIKNTNNPIKNGQKTRKDILTKKMYTRPTGTGKNAQHCQSSEKSKPQRYITSHLSEWLSSKENIITFEDLEKREPLYPVSRNCQLKKRMHSLSWEFSFIWGLLRAIAWETDS